MRLWTAPLAARAARAALPLSWADRELIDAFPPTFVESHRLVALAGRLSLCGTSTVVRFADPLRHRHDGGEAMLAQSAAFGSAAGRYPAPAHGW